MLVRFASLKGPFETRSIVGTLWGVDTYRSWMTFDAAPIANEANEYEEDDHYDFDGRKPIL